MAESTAKRVQYIDKWMRDRCQAGVFRGTPRFEMEMTGMSGGPIYNGLYAMGWVRKGRGAKAVWTPPSGDQE